MLITSGGGFIRTSGGVPVSGVSGRSVLTMADLTWLGSFRAPVQVSEQGGTDPPLMTVRRVGGVARVAWIAPEAGGFYSKGGLLETNLPSLSTTYTSSPVATALYTYGNAWKSLRLFNGWTPTNVYNYFLFWDDVDECYYVQYRAYYNTSAKSDPSLIRITIDEGTHTASATGPYHIGGRIPHQVGGHIVKVPTDYADAYVGGRRLAAGSAAIESGNASSPWGCNLYAFAPPTGATPVWPDSTFGSASATELIGGSITERQRRPGDYKEHGAGDQSSIAPDSYSGTDLTGYWSAMDNSVKGAACWVRTATKEGVIFGVIHGRGHIWYQVSGQPCEHGAVPVHSNQGPVTAFLPADGSEPYGPNYGVQQLEAPAFRIYDPAEFMPVSGRNHHEIPIHDWGYLKSAFSGIHLHTSDSIRPNMTGMCFDEYDNRLYLLTKVYNAGFTYHWHVNVFSVAG